MIKFCTQTLFEKLIGFYGKFQRDFWHKLALPVQDQLSSQEFLLLTDFCKKKRYAINVKLSLVILDHVILVQALNIGQRQNTIPCIKTRNLEEKKPWIGSSINFLVRATIKQTTQDYKAALGHVNCGCCLPWKLPHDHPTWLIANS